VFCERAHRSSGSLVTTTESARSPASAATTASMGRDAPGAVGCGPQAGRLAGLALVDVTDLACAQQAVGVKVATVV